MGSVIPLKKSANSAYLELKNLLESKLQKVENLIEVKLKSDVNLIEKMSEHHLKSGGKRLRALLTLGSAKFASGLNLSDFYKKISRFTLSKKGIEVIGKQAITLAEYENLHVHALSIKSRF